MTKLAAFHLARRPVRCLACKLQQVTVACTAYVSPTTAHPYQPWGRRLPFSAAPTADLGAAVAQLSQGRPRSDPIQLIEPRTTDPLCALLAFLTTRPACLLLQGLSRLRAAYLDVAAGCVEEEGGGHGVRAGHVHQLLHPTTRGAHRTVNRVNGAPLTWRGGHVWAGPGEQARGCSRRSKEQGGGARSTVRSRAPPSVSVPANHPRWIALKAAAMPCAPMFSILRCIHQYK